MEAGPPEDTTISTGRWYPGVWLCLNPGSLKKEKKESFTNIIFPTFFVLNSKSLNIKEFWLSFDVMFFFFSSFAERQTMVLVFSFKTHCPVFEHHLMSIERSLSLSHRHGDGRGGKPINGGLLLPEAWQKQPGSIRNKLASPLL